MPFCWTWSYLIQDVVNPLGKAYRGLKIGVTSSLLLALTLYFGAFAPANTLWPYAQQDGNQRVSRDIRRSFPYQVIRPELDIFANLETGELKRTNLSLVVSPVGGDGEYTLNLGNKTERQIGNIEANVNKWGNVCLDEPVSTQPVRYTSPVTGREVVGYSSSIIDLDRNTIHVLDPDFLSLCQKIKGKSVSKEEKIPYERDTQEDFNRELEKLKN